ncbi:MAG: permease, partial [Pirellulaceae bacterium]
METAWWGAVVRIGQALLACGPTLLVGWLIAALMERLLGREGTFKLFGGHSWRQLPQAWLIGMLLPVCSLGVIPVLRQMRKSGLSGGTILAFGMTAPLFNPISVLYGLTLSDPFAIFVFCIATLTIVTLLGTLWDALFPRNWIDPEPLPPTPYGVRRIGAVAVSMARQSADSSLVYVLLALVGVGVLAAVLPP